MKDIIKIPALLIAAAAIPQSATALAIDGWYAQMLFKPTPAQIEMEATHDRIMIYHGLKDSQVAMAMDQQFDRIDHMMFTGVVVTDESGEAMIDTDTGQILVEDDGC